MDVRSTICMSCWAIRERSRRRLEDLLLWRMALLLLWRRAQIFRLEEASGGNRVEDPCPAEAEDIDDTHASASPDDKPWPDCRRADETDETSKLIGSISIIKCIPLEIC